MFFPLALATVALILIDAGWTKRSIIQVINGEKSTATTNTTGAGTSTATMPVAPSGGNPFKDWIIGRRDQGIDLNAKHPGDPLPALFGTSRVVGILQNWYLGQPYVWLKVLDGPLKDRYYYYAEQIANIRPVGTVLKRGETVCTYASHGTGVEMGFAVADGRTLARATTGYSEGTATKAADEFAKAVGL